MQRCVSAVSFVKCASYLVLKPCHEEPQAHAAQHTSSSSSSVCFGEVRDATAHQPSKLSAPLPLRKVFGEDGDPYTIGIFDMEPSGVIIRALNQSTSKYYALGPTEAELAKAQLGRGQADLAKLAESVQLLEVGGTTFIHSTLPGIAKPKVIPTGDMAKDFINTLTLKDGSMFTELLTTGLSELCKVKAQGPGGIEAVRWLGEWLLANNPNQPGVQEPDED